MEAQEKALAEKDRLLAQQDQLLAQQGIQLRRERKQAQEQTITLISQIRNFAVKKISESDRAARPNADGALVERVYDQSRGCPGMGNADIYRYLKKHENLHP